MSLTKKIILGTAQWGAKYGVANSYGIPTLEQTQQMLTLASEMGVWGIDTAPAYGNAEKKLENSLVSESKLNIISKTKKITSLSVDDVSIRSVRRQLIKSINSTPNQFLYAALVHDPKALLLENGSSLWKMLLELKQTNSVGKIGVSVYCPNQLAEILNNYEIDLVQLPYNIYDQRFLDTGLMARLYSSDIEIHARSIFLQGLFALSPRDLPIFFEAIAEHHKDFRDFCDINHISWYTACLKHCLKSKFVSKVVVGCETIEQIEQLRVLMSTIDDAPDLDYSHFKINDERFILPSNWVL